jgi:hypothetical protein
MTATPSRRGHSAPMVHLRTVPDAFHARVIAARLGADGILTELRGAVDGPYPLGSVSVWVRVDDEPVASDLLLVDELEAAFEDPPDEMGEGQRRGVLIFGWRGRRILATLALLAIVVTIVAGRLLS